jgi:leucyl/phenylalanyl-tRNA--protein transferase
LAVFALDEELMFPPVSLAEPDGLLAIGGDLSPERLLLAYRNGIFPWFQGEDILWWSPDPRFVLFPEELKCSGSMRAIIRKNIFQFRMNHDFAGVIRGCKEAEREGQYGTWITDEMERAYNRLHELGQAISAEAWQDGQLVGGLYGVRLGNFFFGESMFSKTSNASKFAFIQLVDALKKEGLVLIDCQIYTEHLESLGARMIPRAEFFSLIYHL